MEILNNANNKNKNYIFNDGNVLKRSNLKEIKFDLESIEKNNNDQKNINANTNLHEFKSSNSVSNKTSKKIETKYKRQASENLMHKQESVEIVYKNQVERSGYSKTLKNNLLNKINNELNLSENLKFLESQHLKTSYNMNQLNIDLLMISDFKIENIKNQNYMNHIKEWKRINKNTDNISNSKINVSNNEKERLIEIKNSDNPDDNNKQNLNLFLKNKIIKFSDKIYFNQFSLGLCIDITFTMTGNSEFWIFTRVQKEKTNLDNLIQHIKKSISLEDNLNIKDSDKNEIIEDNCCVIIIHKEQKSSRKFISFNILLKETSNNHFKVKSLKKQEIPKHSSYNPDNDSSELNIRIIDNGDNHCCIIINIGSQIFTFEANFYCPVLGFTNIYLAANGDYVGVNNYNVKQIRKNRENIDDFVDKQNCSCCKIF